MHIRPKYATVTGAGMVGNRRGTEAFHWLALVMKQHTAMGRFLGVSQGPTYKLWKWSC